jgi:hypothetical protein
MWRIGTLQRPFDPAQTAGVQPHVKYRTKTSAAGVIRKLFIKMRNAVGGAVEADDHRVPVLRHRIVRRHARATPLPCGDWIRELLHRWEHRGTRRDDLRAEGTESHREDLCSKVCVVIDAAWEPWCVLKSPPPLLVTLGSTNRMHGQREPSVRRQV